jgi:tetratricopeptide (TPR) repeat protein
MRVALIRAELHRSVDGSMELAERDLRWAVELAEEAADQYYLVVAQTNLGILFYNVGRLRDAAESFRRVAALGHDRGSLGDEATATSLLAAVLYHLGPRSEATTLAEQAAHWLERLGDRHLQSQTIRLLGKLALEADDPAQAQQHFVAAQQILPPHKLYIAGLNRLLAEARARQGRVIGARAAAAAAADAASDQGPYAMAFAAIADGCASTAEAAEESACSAFERGLELFEQQQMTTDLADARITYARALSRFGGAARANEQLSLAHGVFEAMGAEASVGHIERLLREMTEGADAFGPLG